MARLNGDTNKYNIKKDLREFLLYFIKCKSDEEKKFSEEQNKCQLKFCLRLFHHPKNDHLVIHTKLKQSQCAQGSTGSESNAPELGDTDFFYIKSQFLSHKSGENILDERFTGPLMSIETVVTCEHSKCETVFKTKVTQTDGGKEYVERSFVREKLKRRSSLQNDVFSPPPSTNEINNMTTFQNDEFHTSKVSKDKKRKKWKSHISGENKRKILLFRDFFKCISKPSLNKNVPKLNLSSSHIRKQSIPDYLRMFSFDALEREDEKPTNIYVTVSLQNQTHNLEVLKDNIDFIDEDEDENDKLSPLSRCPISVTDLCCTFMFQITAEASEKTESVAESDEHCDCEDRRQKISADALKCVSNEPCNHLKRKDLIDILKTFDKKNRHFPGCNYNDTASRSTIFSVTSDDLFPNPLSPEYESLPRSERSRKVSMTSEIINNKVQGIKHDNEINITHDHIKYFQEAKTYKDYESRLNNALPEYISPENLSLFFVLTRKIIMQIDDPNYENNNTDIKRILKYSLTYLIKTYCDEIAKDYSSLEDYLLKYEAVD